MKMNEDYGWEIDPEEASTKLNQIADILGSEETLAAIGRALDSDTLADVLSYICRMYDLSEVVEEAPEEDSFDNYDDDIDEI